MIDASAIEAVAALARASAPIVNVGDEPYATVPLFPARVPLPEPKALVVSTLEAIGAYLDGGVDQAEDAAAWRDSSVVHVAEAGLVRVLSQLRGSSQRAVLLEARAGIEPIRSIGSFQNPGDFMLDLLARFEPTPDRDVVAALVGNLRAEQVQTSTDDGVSQTVTASQGVRLAKTVEAPKVVHLRPFRTFAAVPQPESPFVLRLRGGGDGDLPVVGLFECDGGAWRLAAIQAVASWLRNRIRPPQPVILA